MNNRRIFRRVYKDYKRLSYTETNVMSNSRKKYEDILTIPHYQNKRTLKWLKHRLNREIKSKKKKGWLIFKDKKFMTNLDETVERSRV